MGNTLKSSVDYLKDPGLVRRIQERLGVKEIIVDASSSGDPSHGHTAVAPSIESRHKPPNGGLKSLRSLTESTSSRDSTSLSSTLNNTTNGSLMNSSIEWLAQKAKKRRKIPSLTPKPPASSPPSSPETKTAPPLPDIIIESIPLLDIYFRLATELGYEPFYISFFPFVNWNIDTVLNRQCIYLWCLSMYVGQACKVLFKIKRPASPPALRLEYNPMLETEYGFPSTHAIVSTVIPMYFYYFSVFTGRYEASVWLGLFIALLWCVSVCLSRVYLGVHAVLDILGGITISVAILAIAIPGLPYFDHFVLYGGKYCILSTFALVVFLLYIYPIEPNKWSMDRSDTAAIFGVGLGVICGFSAHGPYVDDLLTGPFIIVLPSLNTVGLSLTRFVVGILLLVPTRFVMKLLCYKLLPAIMPTHGVKEERQRPLVELPYKIITYGAIGFNAVFLSPIVFEMCGISRWESGAAYIGN